MAFLAPVGLTIGALCTAAAWATQTLAAPAAGAVPAALLAGWTWTAADIWLTRGLHWDGVADWGDAVGSGASGDRFWAILRDSRLGAFGALALLLAFSGQWLFASCHAAAGHGAALLLAPGWGRAAAVWTGGGLRPRVAMSLGGTASAGMGPRLRRLYLGLGLGMLLALALADGLSLWRLGLVAAGQAVLSWHMGRLAAAQGGLSGDFYGASIQWSQLWFLLGSL